ncbi:MspA family porin [Nocardia fluminea]|uniref:MspA protein n=1 Tax=Nocardia fluminea TaxID=134984 RepID=A0A2N3WWJ6_9NOCA|nr:MspA family porin [Nocardia fluminea]PKV98236.1 MspA protein [Nocardia fluminea]
MRGTTVLAPRALRIAAMASAVAVGLAMGAGSAAAEIDSSSIVLDGKNRTVEAIQSDTRIDFVAPLDGNPLTREWFHSGAASYLVTGPEAEAWSGRITLGYQVGYPATLDGRIKFEWSTPSLGLEVGADGPTVKLDGIIPRAGIELAAGFGPGIREVEVAGGEIAGAEGVLRLSGFHGTVTGVLGRTNVRPFVRIVGAAGDTVVTYGKTFSI